MWNSLTGGHFSLPTSSSAGEPVKDPDDIVLLVVQASDGSTEMQMKRWQAMSLIANEAALHDAWHAQTGVHYWPPTED